MRQENGETPETMEYQSKRISKPLSRSGRSAFLGMILFGTGYFLMAAIVSFTIFNLRANTEGGIIFLAILSILASGVYLINAIQIGRGRSVPEFILLSAIGGLVLSIVFVAIGLVNALQPPVFALDLIGPGLLTIFPLVQAVWIVDVTRHARELWENEKTTRI